MGVEHGAHVIYDALLFDPKSDFLCCRLALICPIGRFKNMSFMHKMKFYTEVLLLYIAAA
jgi:hypothetical protein